MPSIDINEPWKGPFPNTDSYQNGIVCQTGVEIYNISSAGGSIMTFMFRSKQKNPNYSWVLEEASIDGYGNTYTP